MRLGAIAAIETDADGPKDERGSSADTDHGETPSARSVESRRILVVEDDYLVGLTICDLLTGAGYEVLGPAVSGEEAISMGLEERPDIVLMDVRLAGDMDGVDAALELAEAGIRSLFVSAHSDPLTRSRGNAAAPHGWVDKTLLKPAIARSGRRRTVLEGSRLALAPASTPSDISGLGLLSTRCGHRALSVYTLSRHLNESRTCLRSKGLIG